MPAKGKADRTEDELPRSGDAGQATRDQVDDRNSADEDHGSLLESYQAK
jgi:hypothetical protein